METLPLFEPYVHHTVISRRQGGHSMTISGRTISAVLIAALTLLGSMASGNAASVRETLNRLYWHAPGSQALVARSAAVLVFPTVVKAGFGFGGEYGEGEVLI